MKKNLIAVAVAAMTVVPTVSFAADTKVYGRFNIGVENLKDEIGLVSGASNGVANASTESVWRLRDMNNSSRLGFKGKEDVGLGDLAVIYQLEYGIDPDGTEGSAFSQRNIFLGLTGGFGTVKIGKFDTLVKDAGAKVDQFNDESIGDITFLLRGESRVNDLIQYSSPKLADLVTLNVAVQMGESRQSSDNAVATDKEDGLVDTFYVSADFESGVFFGTLAYGDNDRGSNSVPLLDGATVGSDIIRVAGGVKLPMGLELGALYQTASGIDQAAGPGGNPAGAPNAGDLEDKSWLVSAAYTVDAFKFKGQYGKTDGDVSDNTRDMYALGVDYKLSKALTSQLFYISYSNETGAGVKTDSDSYGLAMVYSF